MNKENNNEIKKLKEELKQLKIALSSTKENKTKELSSYFLTRDNSIYRFNNLNQYLKIIELESEDFLKKLLKIQDKNSINTIDFNIVFKKICKNLLNNLTEQQIREMLK